MIESTCARLSQNSRMQDHHQQWEMYYVFASSVINFLTFAMFMMCFTACNARKKRRDSNFDFARSSLACTHCRRHTVTLGNGQSSLSCPSMRPSSSDSSFISRTRESNNRQGQGQNETPFDWFQDAHQMSMPKTTGVCDSTSRMITRVHVDGRPEDKNMSKPFSNARTFHNDKTFGHHKSEQSRPALRLQSPSRSQRSETPTFYDKNRTTSSDGKLDAVYKFICCILPNTQVFIEENAVLSFATYFDLTPIQYQVCEAAAKGNLVILLAKVFQAIRQRKTGLAAEDIVFYFCYVGRNHLMTQELQNALGYCTHKTFYDAR